MKKSGGGRRGEAIYIPCAARQEVASSQMGASAADPERTQPSRSEAAFQPRFPLELWPQISSSVFFHSQHIHRHRSVHLQVSSTFSLCPRPVRIFNYWVSTTKQHWERISQDTSINASFAHHKFPCYYFVFWSRCLMWTLDAGMDRAAAPKLQRLRQL